MSELDLMREIRRMQSEIDGLKRQGVPVWKFLAAPLTSTSWDGDTHSTSSKTLIDLSAVFGVPAGVRAVAVYVAVADSASQTSDTWMILSPNDTSTSGGAFNPQYTNSRYNRYGITVVPCDANGDIYHQIQASGAGTFNAIIQIWGFLF